MYSYDEIIERSHSKEELVLNYTDAMEILHLFGERNETFLGWEGWILFPDGTYGHSKRYQGTVDLSEMPANSAIALAKSTIMQAHTEWEEKPEVECGELLFCLTMET